MTYTVHLWPLALLAAFSVYCGVRTFYKAPSRAQTRPVLARDGTLRAVGTPTPADWPHLSAQVRRQPVERRRHPRRPVTHYPRGRGR